MNKSLNTKRVESGERIALLVLLILFVFSLITKFFTLPYSSLILTQSQVNAINSGDLFVQISLSIILAYIFLFKKNKNMYYPLTRNLLLLTYLIFLTLTLIYSVDKNITIRRIILLYIIISFGLFLLSIDNDIEYLFRIIYKFTKIYLVITLIGLLRNIFIFKLPAWFIPFSNFGASHRDGEIFAIGLIVTIGIFMKSNKSERNLLFPIILLLVFLLLTGSRTSLIGFFISSLYLIWKLESIGKSTKFILIFTLAVFVLSAYYILPAQSKENIIREDSIDTLTGRIPLWYTLVYGINQNALWGTGFGAFWTVERRETIQFLVGWPAPAAHNGFLEVYLNTGLIGLFFVISLLINVWYKSKFLQRDNSIIAKSLLLYIIIQNLTQGSFQYLRIYVEVVFIWLMIFILLRRNNDNFNNNYIL